jgi:tetratricopeptide (TPR) repeat protein
MLRLVSGRRFLVFAFVAMVAIAFAVPASAQTGSVKGKVVDAKGVPIDKAVVLIQFMDGINYKVETKTNNKGEFIQIGLRSGNYKVTASTKALPPQSFNVRITLGNPTEVNFVLGGAASGAPSAEEVARTASLKKSFEDGVALSRLGIAMLSGDPLAVGAMTKEEAAQAASGKFDEAVAKFTETVALVPKCFDCYYNIGYAYLQKKDYDKAEEAFNKSLEFKPDYFEAYNGLATVYNAQKKFDKAGEASQKATDLAAAAGPAGGGGSVDAEYNSGVIDWNNGKIPDAQVHFLKVIELKPDHAEAHYQMGMAYLNQGKLPEAVAMFEKYLALAPQGPNAATASGILKTIKK